MTMKKIDIAVFGASTRCIALAARELSENINVKVFFDNDICKKGACVSGGYLCVEESRIYVPFDNVCIDVPVNYDNYDFEYLVIFAGRKQEIKEQLMSLGVAPSKIIVFDRLLSNGIVHIPTIYEPHTSLEVLLTQAERAGVPSEAYLQTAQNLLEVCKTIFTSQYKINVLEILVTALKASMEKKIIDYRGVKLDYQLFAINPSLFMYESSDIFMDIIDEEMEQIEFIEGPYSAYGVCVDEGDVVFDFGANYGLFSAIAATKASKGKVYAFEPVKETRDVLQRTVALYDNILIQPYAISDKCGKTQIDVSVYESNQGAASIMNVSSQSVTQEVEMVSLDVFVEEYHIERIDFIKADIEGAERLLLAGANKTLRRFAPKLAICTYHYPEDGALLEFMIKQANPDYVIERAYGKLYAYVNRE